MNKNIDFKNQIILKRNLAWNTFGCLFYLACNWITTVLVVTLSDDYVSSGTLAVAMSVGNIFSAVMLYRVRTIQVADIQEHCSASNYVAHRFITFLISFCTCAVYSLFTVVAADYSSVIAYMIFKAGDAFADVLHGNDQKHDRFEYIGISHIIRGIVTTLCFIAGMLFAKSVFVAIMLMAFGNILSVVLYDVPKSSQWGSIKPTFAVQKICWLFLHSTPGFLSLFIITLVVSITRQAYGLNYGNEELGIYAAIAAPVVIIQALANYLYTPLLGPIAHLWKEGHIAEIVKYILKFTGILLLIIMIAIFIFNFFGEYVLGFIFQKNISSYMGLLTPLIVSVGTTAILYFVIDIAIICHEYAGAIIGSALSLLFAAVVMEWLFCCFGQNGISFTIIIAQLVNLVVSGGFICLRFIKKNNQKNKG